MISFDRTKPGHNFIIICGAGTHNRGEVQVTENKIMLTYLLDQHRIPYVISGRADDPYKKLDRVFISVKDTEIRRLENFLCDALLFMQKMYKRSHGFSLKDVRGILEKEKVNPSVEWDTR